MMEFHKLKGLPYFGACLIEATDIAIEAFMTAVEKEIQHRYQILEQHPVLNIYQYLKLQKKAMDSMEEMPHMVIFFVEAMLLKFYYPEIFKNLKELGSRKNSSLLGIHLIFSTQDHNALIDESVFRMVDFRICSRMQRRDTSDDMKNEVSWCPDRLYLQSKSSSEIQLIQLAYCCTEINDGNRTNYNWFYEKKSQKAELIDLIKRYEFD